jgi:outer membrane murein-binding lipoprotein Lpp
MIVKLEGYLAELTVQSDELTTQAQIKAEIFNQAQDAVDVMTSKVKALQTQVDAATEEANQAQQQLGQLAAQMYRDGAG